MDYKSKNVKCIFKVPQKLLLGLFSCIFFSAITLVYLIIWIPIYTWRLVAVFITKKLFYKKYGRILKPMDIFSYSQNSTGAPQSSLVCIAELERELTVQQVREIFTKLVLERTVSNKSNWEDKPILRYPELRQYEVDWLGFQFLKWEEKFNVEDHIVEVSDHNQTFGIGQVHAYLLNREFTKKKSPWELVLFNRVPSENDSKESLMKTYLGFRIHHTIADGLSTLKLFVECLGGKRLVKASRSLINGGSNQRKLLSLLYFPFSFGIDSFNFWKDVLTARSASGTHFGLAKPNKSRRVIVGITKKVDMEEIKGLAKRLQVTSSSVIMAGILGGYGKFVKRQSDCSEKKLRKIPMGYVLPVDGHPDIFANHWKTTYTTVDLATLSSSSTRIKMCMDAFQEMKTGRKAELLNFFIFLSGTCFSGPAKMLLKNRICSFGITNIAGEEEGFGVGGKECVDFSLSFGGISGIGLMFCVMSYRNFFRVSCVAEKNQFFTEENEVDELANLIYQEYQDFFVENGTCCV